MPDFDPKEFMNQTHYALDFRAMMGDVLDFLEFSERNIDWLYGVEKQSIEQEAARGWGLPQELAHYESGYTHHKLENAEHRFTVSLPMRVRYAALVMLVTAVEWQAKTLRDLAESKVPKLPTGNDRDKPILILKCLSNSSSVDPGNAINNLELLIHARNLVVHAAGLPKDYKHQDIQQSVKQLKGFFIGKWHFIGETLIIERGALVPCIEELEEFMPKLCEELDKRGFLS